MPFTLISSSIRKNIGAEVGIVWVLDVFYGMEIKRVHLDGTYRDGGTKIYLLVYDDFSIKRVYEDNAFGSSTRGLFFDEYPGHSKANLISEEEVKRIVELIGN